MNGYFNSLLDKMDEKDRTMVKSALEKLETALDDGERARD